MGDVVNPLMRPAGILVPADAGRRAIIAGFGQIEAQVLKVGMVGEAVCVSLPFTIILVASSVTCQYGVFAGEKGDLLALRRWFVLTFLMRLVFVLGLANEYRMQVNDCNTISATGYGSVFYLTTGFHGLHVTGGLIAFLLVIGRTFIARRFTHEQAVSAIVISYYWHFVDVVWIGLFATIYLIQ